jgi:hypothetical protein
MAIIIFKVMMRAFAFMSCLGIGLFFNGLYIGRKDKIKRSYSSQSCSNDGCPLAFAKT